MGFQDGHGDGRSKYFEADPIRGLSRAYYSPCTFAFDAVARAHVSIQIRLQMGTLTSSVCNIICIYMQHIDGRPGRPW
jgi:hypothetical protein